ncbi:adrenocortical dysplasia protein homolog isoform X2 [Taeniopygia guttata]|uniref:adrenocortical dysplasia protein homolog isoform X2 n=1 Tax=Taeniopygia guttata TaxID=59729 RepID=UPI003BB902AF
MAAAAAAPGGASPGLAAGERLVCVDKNVASPKLYVLEPWIADLLVNYEQQEERENFLAGQVVQVLSDSTAAGQPEVHQDAVVQVSDGSCYIRVVITAEALQAEENAHLQLRLSSLNCRIIVLQKYTVCFQDEARLVSALRSGSSLFLYLAVLPALLPASSCSQELKAGGGLRVLPHSPAVHRAAHAEAEDGIIRRESRPLCGEEDKGALAEETPVGSLFLPVVGSTAAWVSPAQLILQPWRSNTGDPQGLQSVLLQGRNLAVRNAASSEPSVSQLIDAIGQNQLEILKENAEECLDLWKSKEKPVTVEDEVPITQWEAERKKEGEDVFMVPVSALVIPPEQEAVVCDSSEAASAGYTETSQAAPGKSSDDKTVPGDQSVVSQISFCLHSRGAPALGSSSWPPMNAPDPIQPLVSSTVGSAHLLGLSGGGAASPTLSDSLEGSLDNPWNRLPSLSLTPSSSDEKTFQADPPLKTQKDVAADSNTTDLLEVCSQSSPESLPQGEPAQISSPSLLRCYSNPSPAESSTSEAASAAGAARGALCADQGPQGSRGTQATLPTLSPVFPVLPSSSLQLPPGRIPHREQACSSGTASSTDVLKPGLAHTRTKGGETVGAKRKLVEEDEQAPSGQQHLPGTSKGRGRGRSKRLVLTSSGGAKKSRKETRLQRRKELEEKEEEEMEKEEEEEEQASPARAGPSSRLEQCTAPEPFVERPPQYQYEAPSPELCQQVQSIRISKAMLKWACWILTEEDEDS